MKRIIYFILILFLFAACKKKELPVTTIANPVFSFSGTVGSETVNYQAGVNHIYMYSDFFKDSQNLTTVRGYFASDSCTNCEPFLSFEAKDNAQTNGLTLSQGIALIFGKIVFTSYSLDSLATNTPVEKFTFTPDVNNPANAQYYWSFGDGDTSSTQIPTHIYAQPGGIRNVQLVVSKNNTQDSLTNSIDATYGSTCRAQFSYTIDTSLNRVYLNASNGFSYLWSFGNGLTSILQNDTATYNNNGTYNINLVATAGGCTSTYMKKVTFPFSPSNPSANFSYSVTIDSIPQYQPRLNSSAFIITWKKNGQTYYSYKNIKGINQSNNTIFTLTGISLYSKNEKGNSTVKVTGNVDTYLYNSINSNDSIKIKSDNLTFAVAYPD